MLRHSSPLASCWHARAQLSSTPAGRACDTVTTQVSNHSDSSCVTTMVLASTKIVIQNGVPKASDVSARNQYFRMRGQRSDSSPDIFASEDISAACSRCQSVSPCRRVCPKFHLTKFMWGPADLVSNLPYSTPRRRIPCAGPATRSSRTSISSHAGILRTGQYVIPELHALYGSALSVDGHLLHP